MSYFEAILLGVIQGLTEILPISSSGHLVLTEHILQLKQPGILFELMVHFGTLLSVLVYFHKKIFGMIKSVFDSSRSAERKMVYYLIVGTIPAVIAALLLDDFFEEAFSSPVMTSVMLLVTGLILLSTKYAKLKKLELNIPRSVIIGIGQALAIMPGISRSGTTISTGLFLGLKPYEVAEFSFLLSIPAILGAIVFKFKAVLSLNSEILGPYLVGTIFAFLTGLFAVYIMLDLIRKGKFVYFGIYC
ncbi:MAG: undecaprenyl-diphosphate phosphatase, partial [candidate division Zixibacteria bacterium]|nr:undecaprenyl-diphosphate phosphatase [candidate division Zixibacteria bacterium]